MLPRLGVLPFFVNGLSFVAGDGGQYGNQNQQRNRRGHQTFHSSILVSESLPEVFAGQAVITRSHYAYGAFPAAWRRTGTLLLQRL